MTKSFNYRDNVKHLFDYYFWNLSLIEYGPNSLNSVGTLSYEGQFDPSMFSNLNGAVWFMKIFWYFNCFDKFFIGATVLVFSAQKI